MTLDDLLAASLKMTATEAAACRKALPHLKALVSDDCLPGVRALLIEHGRYLVKMAAASATPELRYWHEGASEQTGLVLQTLDAFAGRIEDALERLRPMHKSLEEHE